MSSAGTKVEDEKQEYQFSMPWVTASGHELTFYDTPDNERVVLKHASGSHIEFKSDGAIFLKSVKDVHTHTSIVSQQSGKAAGADNTTSRSDRDYTWEIGGRLRIKCQELDFEIGSTGKIIAGTDLIVESNNTIAKATEQISLEAEKSVYVDAKEYRERVVSRRTETGTEEDNGEKGGINVMKVHGNAIIQNDDPTGGITIASAGYLNLVAGAERVDLIGKYTTTPSTEAMGTFTTKVFASKGSLDVSSAPGDIYLSSEAGAYYQYASKVAGSSISKTDGYKEDVKLGNRVRVVETGLENIAITGTQTVKAAMIYLN